MTDSDKNSQPDIERHKEVEETSLERRDELEAREVSETKTSIGMEAGEIIEDAEFGTGEISETEQRARDKGKSAVAISIAKRQMATPPSLPKMRSQVKRQLKKDIKQMNKKIKKVMRNRSEFEPWQINNLIKRLRNLKELLSSLAYATTEMVKDLWIKHVRDNKSIR